MKKMKLCTLSSFIPTLIILLFLTPVASSTCYKLITDPDHNPDKQQQPCSNCACTTFYTCAAGTVCEATLAYGRKPCYPGTAQVPRYKWSGGTCDPTSGCCFIDGTSVYQGQDGTCTAPADKLGLNVCVILCCV